LHKIVPSVFAIIFILVPFEILRIDLLFGYEFIRIVTLSLLQVTETSFKIFHLPHNKTFHKFGIGVIPSFLRRQARMQRDISIGECRFFLYSIIYKFNNQCDYE
jgi:hypothetical protein